MPAQLSFRVGNGAIDDLARQLYQCQCIKSKPKKTGEKDRYQTMKDLSGQFRQCQCIKTAPEQKHAITSLYRLGLGACAKQFYMKKCWEGKIREALGLELYNILSGQKIFDYILLSGTNRIMLREVPGTPGHEIKPGTQIPIKPYAKAMELACTLGLGDRENIGNTLFSDETVTCIDFGQIFREKYEDAPLIELALIQVHNQEELYRQRVIARGEIAGRVQQNKNNIAALVAEAKKLGPEEFKGSIPEYLENPVSAMMAYLTSPVPAPERIFH